MCSTGLVAQQTGAKLSNQRALFQGAKGMGLDLNKMTLTSQGFRAI